jgi:DnaD/phage-associated family protein
MSEEDVLSVFYYWEEMGLVNVINVDPILVRYLPVKNALYQMKKYNVDKYTAFNISAQELIGSKMLTPREFEEFYYIIENLHMDKEALLRVIEYCKSLKGKSVAVSYIIAVAKNWVHDGVRTITDVEERLEEQERVSGDVVLVLKALGTRRKATTDEYQMYLTWTKDLDMPLDLIVHIAKKTKSKNFNKLNDVVMKCYSNRLLSIKEVDDYLKSLDNMYGLAKTVVKNLGLWYDNLENVVDSYILPWLNMGFEIQAVEKLSNYAFKSNVRTLEAFNNNINNMYKLGVLTSNSVDNYMEDIVKMDKEIASILTDLGIERGVISSDRTMFKTWIFDWNIVKEVLEHAVSISKGKYSAMQYLNRVLSEYHGAGIKTKDEASKFKLSFESSRPAKTSSSPKSAKKREYTKKQLDSLFDDITEIEI